MGNHSDTILRSTVRTFFKSIAVVVGIFVAFIPLVIMFMSVGAEKDLSDKTTTHILPDENGRRVLLHEKSPAILEIKIHGIIGQGLTAENIENILLDSRTRMFRNDRVKAVLLNINTPGGGVNDSDQIYRLIKNYKAKYNVPVFAYVDGMCASGGYYIACAADRIYSSQVGIVGSVGVVIGPFLNFYDTLNRWGVKAKTLTKGEGKDPMNPLRPWKPDEDENLQSLLAFFYETFVDIVTSNRPQISKSSLINTYGARIFDAKKATEIGMIDQYNVGEKDVLSFLAKEANISEPYQVVELAPRKSWLSSMFDAKSYLPSIFFKANPLCDEQFAYLYQPGVISFHK